MDDLSMLVIGSRDTSAICKRGTRTVCDAPAACCSLEVDSLNKEKGYD
jgi:hypothetical protein